MLQVSMLFHDASIGNSVNINVVKLLLLDEKQVSILNYYKRSKFRMFCHKNIL